jgi:crossover junction endodeoxyribonuclease RusA
VRRFEFVVVGHPQAQGSKIAGVAKSGARYVRESNKSLPGWRQLVMDQAQRFAPSEPLEGPIRLNLIFYLPVPKSAPKTRKLAHTKKPDRLKLARAVEDALKGVFYRDDSQVVEGETIKRYAYSPYQIGVRVQIYEVEGVWNA